MKKLMLTGVMASSLGVTVWAVAEPAHDHDHGNVATTQAPVDHGSMMAKHQDQMQAQMSSMQGIWGHKMGHPMGDMQLNHSDMMKGMR